MVKKLTLIYIFIIMIFCGAKAEPILTSPKDKFDFGFTTQNATLVHQFWLKSIGTDTVHIDLIKTGCSCAVTSKDRDYIAPGDSLEIKIQWDLKHLRGSLFRAIRVFHDKNPDPFYLSMEGWVSLAPDSVGPVKIRPYRFELAKTSQLDIDSLSFTLTNKTDKDLTVQLVSALPEECQLEIPSTVPAHGKSIGFVKVLPEYKDTIFKSSITLLFGDKEKTRITIPIRRKVYNKQ